MMEQKEAEVKAQVIAQLLKECEPDEGAIDFIQRCEAHDRYMQETGDISTSVLLTNNPTE